MKQSTVLIMAAFGILAFTACGTQQVAKGSTTVESATGGTGEGNGETTPVVVTPVTPVVVSKIPTGPTGAPTGNVDFRNGGGNIALLGGLVGGIAGGINPNEVLGGLSSLANAFSRELNVGTQSCDAGGTFTANSTGGDADNDGIPVKAMVTFKDCKYTFVTGNQSGSVKLNGKLELEDHNPNDDDSTFMLTTSMDVQGTGGIDIAGSVLDLNGGAKLNLGLDINKNASSYDIAFGADLNVDGKTIAARLDVNVAPQEMGDFSRAGSLKVSGKLGYSEPGSDTIIGLNSSNLMYDRTCGSIINKGSFTVTDGKNNLEIIQNSCNVTDAKLNGSFIDL
jgi:hypothetical protein